MIWYLWTPDPEGLKITQSLHCGSVDDVAKFVRFVENSRSCPKWDGIIVEHCKCPLQWQATPVRSLALAQKEKILNWQKSTTENFIPTAQYVSRIFFLLTKRCYLIADGRDKEQHNGHLLDGFDLLDPKHLARLCRLPKLPTTSSGPGTVYWTGLWPPANQHTY